MKVEYDTEGWDSEWTLIDCDPGDIVQIRDRGRFYIVLRDDESEGVPLVNFDTCGVEHHKPDTKLHSRYQGRMSLEKRL